VASDREARLDALLDRQEIADCISSMSRGTDRCDRDLFLSAFHDDAVMSAGPFVGGPAELYDWSYKLQKDAYRSTYHGLLNQRFDIDGDTAHAETYYLFVGSTEDTNIVAGGRYVDRFERREGRWAIAMRSTFVEWTSAVPAMDSPLGDIGDLALNGLPAQDKSDPSYQRPHVNRRALNNPDMS